MSKMKNSIKLTLFLLLGGLLGFLSKSIISTNEIKKLNDEHTAQIKQLEYEHWENVYDTTNYLNEIHRKVSLFYKFQTYYSNSYYKSKVSNRKDHNLIKLADQLVDIIVELRQTNLKKIGWIDLYAVKDVNTGLIDYLYFGDVPIVFSEELESVINECSELKEYIKSP